MSGDDTAPRFHRSGFSGQDVPFYGLVFDKRGQLQSPMTKDAVIDRIAAEGFTDTILFSHGWNNEWDHAADLYTRFLDGVGGMATGHAGELPVGIKPLMIGISWPSAAFTWPWDRAPVIASGGGPLDDLPEATELDDLAFLTDVMGEGDATSLRELVADKDVLTAEEVDRFAALLAPTLGTGEVEEFEPSDVTPEGLAAMFKVSELAAKSPDSEGDDDDEEDNGFATGGTIGGGADEAEAAGIVSDLFGVRTVLRLATVRTMKDRAGVVGRGDVTGLVSDILAQTTTRLHTVGHSYGAKVVMSAISRAVVPRPVTSALLLQPAINHLAFAANIGDGRPGGFRSALAKVEKPILTTRSRKDFPLRSIFHIAVSRQKDIGEEPRFAGTDLYGAMGGYGPSGLEPGELLEISMPAGPGNAYPQPAGVEVIDLEASDSIGGHSKITNDATFWAMLQNIR